jgi:thiosulfate dehydrogenase [quinone] large subunit
MFGFITLALAGHGGLLVLDNLLPRRSTATSGRGPSTPVVGGIGRREVLQAAALGLAAIVLGAASRVLLGVGRAAPTDGGGAGSPAPSSPPSGQTPSPSATPTATASAGPVEQVIGNANEIAAGQSVGFVIPSSGDPGAVIKLTDGTVVAYDLVCTHEGCEVGFDAASGILRCPCHGATFDPAQDGLVLGGPARRPLPSVPLRIDPATGAITLAT